MEAPNKKNQKSYSNELVRMVQDTTLFTFIRETLTKVGFVVRGRSPKPACDIKLHMNVFNHSCQNIVNMTTSNSFHS